MATAGKMHAWMAMEKTIRAGGRCFGNIEPNVKRKATKINKRDWAEWIFPGFPI